MTAAGTAAAAYPAGHIEGYPDTFRALFAAVYRDVAAGVPSARPSYPTFADAVRKAGDAYRRTRLTSVVSSLLRRYFALVRKM